MILCIDSSKLKTSQQVQKDVDLEDLINNHTKYYNSVEEALKDKYVPLDFSVSVRSLYSNLVLENDKGDRTLYYTNLTNIQPFVHKGYDLIMYLASIGVMNSVNYKSGFDDLMTRHSQFMPIGLYNPEPFILNPIIYSHVLISDEGAKELPKYLKVGSRLVDINTMMNNKEGNISAMLDTLFIEAKKEENSNE